MHYASGSVRLIARHDGGVGWLVTAIVVCALAAKQKPAALILTPLTALGAVVTPALQGMMSRTVPDDAQGELQGVLTSVAAISMIVSPFVMTQIFAFFTGPSTPYTLPGAPFLLSMLLMVASAVVFLAPRSRNAT